MKYTVRNDAGHPERKFWLKRLALERAKELSKEHPLALVEVCEGLTVKASYRNGRKQG